MTTQKEWQSPVPLWTVVAAAGAPLVLIVTSVLARLVRTAAYDPVAQTMSVLAGRGGGDWVMTSGFVISAGCQILTATGLRALRPLPRIALATSGCCGLAVAALPVQTSATNNAHLLAAGAGAIVLALWPVLSITAKATAPPMCRMRWAAGATLVLAALLSWVYYEATRGVVLGLAERTAAVGELTWPLIVAVSARRMPRPEG